MEIKEQIKALLAHTRMRRAATMTALLNMSEELSPEKRVEIWNLVEEYDDRIQKLEEMLKKL